MTPTLRRLIFIVAGAAALSCGPCDESKCDKLPRKCRRRPDRIVKDVCGCCDVCAKLNGEPCGGPWDMNGKCAKNLKCVKSNPSDFNASGVCKRKNMPFCMCPANYQPVCGQDGKTYSNSCLAGCKNVSVAYPGPCNNRPQPVATCPQNCVSYYDGCNTCTCSNGTITACTRRFCFRKGNAFCRRWKWPSSRPPVANDMPSVGINQNLPQQQITITPADDTYLIDQRGYLVRGPIKGVLKKNTRIIQGH